MPRRLKVKGGCERNLLGRGRKAPAPSNAVSGFGFRVRSFAHFAQRRFKRSNIFRGPKGRHSLSPVQRIGFPSRHALGVLKGRANPWRKMGGTRKLSWPFWPDKASRNGVKGTSSVKVGEDSVDPYLPTQEAGAMRASPDGAAHYLEDAHFVSPRCARYGARQSLDRTTMPSAEHKHFGNVL